MSTNADAFIKITVEQLAAKLPDTERVRVAKAMVVAAFQLCPAQPTEDVIGPDRLALGNTMLGAVNALLHTQAERRRAEFWDALQGQQTAIAAHGLH
jgi:hypothetical protein